MAIKYMPDAAAARLKELAAEAGVTEAEILSVAMLQLGERARDIARKNREEREELRRRQLGRRREGRAA